MASKFSAALFRVQLNGDQQEIVKFASETTKGRIVSIDQSKSNRVVYTKFQKVAEET